MPKHVLSAPAHAADPTPAASHGKHLKEIYLNVFFVVLAIIFIATALYVLRK
jgi:hypothetical protein